MSLLIRPSTDADLPAIAAIYAPAVRHGTASFELEPPEEAEMARRRRALLDGGYPYLVAERDGTVVGYAYAGAYRPRPAYRSTVEDSVYVAPAAQGAGVGRALLAALVAECEARDFRLMVAVIGDEASRSSIRLHEALGFRLVGVIDGIGHKHGRWLATVLMQRALGPGTSTPPTIALSL
ncbi:MAG TPA: GNAT family N-acetyltransferase [Microvirga sp.]|jgi:phosphinothricin acetyltransferase|nr:GNAT family N-acetyltransferase [Microvirga sp.]